MTYSIIQADLKKDRDNILALWKRNFQGVPEERYSWIYEKNPSGPASCWLAKNSKDNSIVGSSAIFPRKILVNGEYYIAGIAGDFVVNKVHRGLGPALSLQKAIVSGCNGKGFDFLYGFPNKKSEAVLLRAGYKILGEVFRLTKPLRSYYHLKKYIDIPVVTKTVSKSVDLAMKIISKKNYYKNSDEYTCEILSSFDERFDELWEKVSTRFLIIGERSSSYLNWRFIHSPHKNHHVFALTKKDSGNILGYIVFNIIENGTNIDDILSLDMGNTLDSLLSEYLLFQRKEDIDSVSISYIGNQFLVKKLQEFGFSIRDGESKVVLYSPPDSPFIPYLIDEGNWYLLAGDNDI